MLLFKLTIPDLKFYIVLGVIVAVVIIAYFLTPVIKRKQYAEARANLAKREETFRANLKNLNQNIENKSEK